MKPSTKVSLCLPALTLALALAASTNQAADPAPLPAGDEILRVARAGFVSRALPQGPDRPGLTEFSADIDELTILPDGRMMAVSYSETAGEIRLLRVNPDGSLVSVGVVAPPAEVYTSERPTDLKADASGHLYLLTEVLWYWNPPDVGSRLVEIDPDDASTISSRRLPYLSAIALAPQGMWVLTADRLRRLDPTTGKLSGPSFSISPHGAYDMDVDSTGAIWFWDEGVCSPPCPAFHRLDPATGAITTGIGPSAQTALVQDLVIRRRCSPSDTAFCLQGGRFRAELTWKDFLGQTGQGKVAEGRSADTGLFYFFEKKNWELMVKVLNGCGTNGHFWVYGSASTTVEYALKVTDLETGAVRIYSNPLGQLATTITDSTAFACPQ